jgi:hypothetical protein
LIPLGNGGLNGRLIIMVATRMTISLTWHGMIINMEIDRSVFKLYNTFISLYIYI